MARIACMRKIIPVVFLLSFALMGCGSRYSIYECSVDARAVEPLSSSNKVFLFSEPPPGVDPLEYGEFAGILRRALVNRGFSFADSPDGAARLIRFSYGIGSGETVGYAAQGQSMAIRNAYNGEYIGFAGSSTAAAIKEYPRHLRVSATMRDGKTPAWSVVVLSEGSSKNIRDVFPAMTVAASAWFGGANSKTSRVRVNPNSVNQLIAGGATPIPAAPSAASAPGARKENKPAQSPWDPPRETTPVPARSTT